MINAKELRAQHATAFLYYLVFLAVSAVGLGVMIYTQNMLIILFLMVALTVVYFALVAPKADKYDASAQQSFVENTMGRIFDHTHHDPLGGVTREDVLKSGIFGDDLGYVLCYRRMTGQKEIAGLLEEAEIGEIQYNIQDGGDAPAQKGLFAHLHCEGRHASPIRIIDGEVKGEIPDNQKDIVNTLRSMTEGAYDLTIDGEDAFLFLPDREMHIRASVFRPLKDEALHKDQFPELKLLRDFFAARSV